MKEKVLDATPATIGDVKHITWLAFQHNHRFDNLYPKASVFAIIGGFSAYGLLEILHTPTTHFAWTLITIVVVASGLNIVDYFLCEDYNNNITHHAEHPKCVDEDENYYTPKYLRSSDTKEKS